MFSFFYCERRKKFFIYGEGLHFYASYTNFHIFRKLGFLGNIICYCVISREIEIIITK